MTNTYPIPFSTDFYHEVTSLPSHEVTSSAYKEVATSLSKDDKNYDKIYKKYAKTKTVILVKVIHQDRKYLLDELTDWILANSIITRVGEDYKVTKIKSNGSLGIFVTDIDSEAINFAKDLKENLSGSFNLSIGISKGDVLIFDLGNDISEIAGEPVNIASKIAEDCGQKDCILVEESVLCNEKKCKPFKYNISKVDISGVIL